MQTLDTQPQSKIFFMNPILDSLNKGGIIRDIMAFLFRLIGVLIIGGIVYFFFKTISNVPDLWSFLLLLLVLGASFIAGQSWFYHAKEILGYADSNYSAIPIVAHLFRALGETYAIFASAIAVGGILMFWFSNYVYFLYLIPLFHLLPSIGQSNFVGGLEFFFVVFIVAYLVLLITYFLAENVSVLVDIARNTKLMRASARKEELATDMK